MVRVQPSDPQVLARRAHLNMVEAFASLPAHQAAGSVLRNGAVVVAVTGSPLPLFNQVLPVDDTVSPAALAEGVRHAKSLDVPFFVQLHERTVTPLRETVQGLGLIHDDSASWPVMVLPHLSRAGLPPHPPQELTVRRLEAADGVRSFVQGSVAITGAGAAVTRSWLGDGLAHDSRWALFNGYVHGEPVAQSMCFRSAEMVGVYNVATRPEYRRRGYAGALTRAAVDVGAQAGCTAAVLQSSAMARSLYEGLGFRVVFGYSAFRFPK